LDVVNIKPILQVP